MEKVAEEFDLMRIIKRITRYLVVLVLVLLSFIVVARMHLSSFPDVAFPVQAVRDSIIFDGGTMYVVYEDVDGRALEVGVTPATRILASDIAPFNYEDDGVSKYLYIRRYSDYSYLRFRSVAEPCSGLEDDIFEFLSQVSMTNPSVDVDSMMLLVERHREVCRVDE